ncbi:MAG: hypothetical protein WCT85_01470 [Parachlamydiales bacterium]
MSFITEIPSEAIDSTIEQIKKVYLKKGYIWNDIPDMLNSKTPYIVNILGVRASEREANDFDDRIIIIYNDNTGKKIQVFPATTDAGKYWLEHPTNPKGTAILVAGQYKDCYALGLHQGKYKALCQIKNVKTYRDGDLDDILDLDPKTITEGIYGINIHKSNPYTESSYVDKWSAGCQVFKIVEHFNTFISILEKSEKLHGNIFTYTLFDEIDFNEIDYDN